ncbi:MAG TPA: hypothetical protein VLG49_00160 [Rhabdochlamydiaceae bacterium]|nr:hypothetical protein [Rhabdochlamydiaceae bacterium]
MSIYSSLMYSFENNLHGAMIPQSSNIYTLDKELRSLEKEQIETLLPLIQSKAKELGNEFFEHFAIAEITSDQQALEYRYLYVPILYKLGMTKEASRLAQTTFEYLFPQLHNAVEARIVDFFGKDYINKYDKLIQEFLCQSHQIDRISYRIKSTHSIWKKVMSLEAFERMTQKEFAAYVDDFIGIRWEMKVLEDENRYDALINGIRLAPLKNIKTFRNQQLPQESGFSSEPVIKLCYLIDGFPIELQLLGGNITAYMCAKGYSDYKAKLSFSPKKDEIYERHRLGMAIKLGEQAAFRKYMLEELLGIAPNYSEFTPFVLDILPQLEKNRTVRFSHSLKPICELSNLNFEEDVPVHILN